MANGFLQKIGSVFGSAQRKQALAILEAENVSLKSQVEVISQQRSVETKEIQAIYNQSIINQAMWYYGGVISTDATPDTAITVPAIMACVNRISGTIESAPLQMFKKVKGGKQLVEEDFRFTRLCDTPNELMTSSDFWRAMIRQLKLAGFAFADIIYNQSGVPFLYPLEAYRHLTYQDEKGFVYYEIFLKSGKMLKRYESDVIHLRGHTREGINSDDPIVLLRTTLMMALSLRSHGVNFFKNFANIGGIIEHPSTLGEDAINNLKKSMAERNSGTENAGRTLILEEGAKYSKQADSLLNSQYEQLIRLMNAEIARFFGVPPHKIAILDNANYSNMEVQNSEYLNDTILPLVVQIEREMTRKILYPANPKLVFKFDLDSLKRAEFDTRMAGYIKGVQWGIFSPNECRAREGLNPYDGGDDFLTPLNMSKGEDNEALNPKKTDNQKELEND